MNHARLTLCLCALLVSAVACGEDSDDKCKERPAPNSAKGVAADLSPWWPDACAKGASVRQVVDGAGLIGGSAAQGRDGDWALANKKVRFIVQAADRHSGPCPWGGNVIDADVVRAKGEAGADNMGEYCPLINLGRTFRGEVFEVLNDGSKGGPAILAVSGQDSLLDFINLPSLVGQYLGAPIKLPFDPELDLPIEITRYYILPPDDGAMVVVSAIRNDGTSPTQLAWGEIIDSGGQIQFFNPASSLKGFGYKGLNAEKLDFLAFRGAKSSHAFAPPLLDGAPGGSYLAISGVAGIVLGTTEAMAFLTSPAKDVASHPATLKLAPGETVLRQHLVAAGSGDLGTLTGPIWRSRGIALGTANGIAKDDTGKGVPGLRISALDPEGAAWTQALTDKDGRFSLQLPAGSWTFSGDAPGRKLTSAGSAKIEPGAKVADIEVEFGPHGGIDVVIRNSVGQPSPGKVTVFCQGKCKHRGKSEHQDVTFDKLPSNVAAVAFTGIDGQATIPLIPGPYRVVVSRGPAWSLHPQNAYLAGGTPVEVVAGEPVVVNATLYRAIDTSGWLSADLHVHAINSPDSPVTNIERVKTYLSEGLDVLIPTDHDFITDMAPAIQELDAEHLLATVPGLELTTFDYGHFNAFPLKVDAIDLTGGALDWGGGDGPSLHPKKIREGLAALGDKPVIQVNHPGGGYLGAIEFDVSAGITLADPAGFRIKTGPPDPKTGDTGLFDPGFTAVEILNGNSMGKFWNVARWWFALLSRGVRWTATAVSDSHNWHSSPAGGARTWVYMGPDKDSVEPFDAATFAAAINGMNAFGSNAPFVKVQANNDKGDKVGLGGTLSVPKGGQVTFQIEVQAAQWVALDAVEMYRNPTDTATPPGEENKTHVQPTKKKKLLLNNSHLVAGVDDKTWRWRRVIKMTDTVTADGYYVFMIRGAKPLPKGPTGGKTVVPFAYTNPIFVDADGGGYNHPPLGWSTPPPPPPPVAMPPRGPTFDDLSMILDTLARTSPCH